MNMAVSLDYTEDVKRAIQIAQSIAKEFSNEKFSPAHLLKALLHKDTGLLPYLESHDKDVYFMEEWADVRIETSPKSSKVGDSPKGDDKVAVVFEEADNIRIKLGKDTLDSLCLLAALSTPGIAFSYDQLKTFPITQQEILADSVEKSSLQQAISPGSNGTAKSSSKSNALLTYCIDKTALGREGKLDAIIGRDRETRMISEILGRRSKPNVIIIGEPGVGKTALVNGFVQNIVDDKVPDNLKSAIIFELDFGSLIAGASYKGEVEDRLKKIISEVKQFDRAILFIDNIHNLIDKNGGAAGAANILKPELAKGELTIIGTTSNDDYRKFIETDEAFSRMVEVLKVDEPDETTSYRMIKTIIPYYEAHHKINLGEDVIPESIRLAKRFIKDRRLPDAAIDLIDRTMSVVRMMGETSKEEIEGINEGFLNLKNDSKNIEDAELVKELKWFASQLKDKVSHVLFSQIEDERDVQKMDSANEITEYLTNAIAKLHELAGNRKELVEKSDVAAVVSHKTGIPMGKLQAQERDKLLNMEGILKKRVVGQDHAIKAISEAILESRSGLSKPGQPIGSFFMLGPTGTGKTELAKSLAEFLFTDETSLIRFDMSEFKEEHSAALLYGAPPGYVGYEEGGLLVNKIRAQPYSIVLFDEIEKAHPSVFDLFLQILDEGKLHDRLGKEGDFSNSVVLFTSNIGSQHVVEKFEKGEVPGTNELMDIMGKFFRPEFLGRLTEIVPFAPISENIVVNIFEIHLKNLLKILEKQGITLNVSQEAKEFLAKSGFTPKYGARPLTGVIRNQLRRPLSKMIISGELMKGDTMTMTLNDEQKLIWKKS